MQTVFTSTIIPNKRAESSRINEKWLEKKVNFDADCFPFVLLEKNHNEKIYFFPANTKNISSHVLKIFHSCYPLVNLLHYHNIRWNIFGIHLKQVNILYAS